MQNFQNLQATSLQVLKQTELCGQQFTVYGTAEQPLFKAQELAEVLSLTNVSDMISRVEVEEVAKLNLGSLQGETWFLTEDGMYEVLMQSRKPIAKQFKKGVKTILKEIRRTGGYLATQAEDTPEMIMARALQVAQQTIENHRQQVQMLQGENEVYKGEIKTLAPKAAYTDEVLQSTSTFTATQIAKDLGMAAVTLNRKLQELGIQYYQSNQWFLTHKYQSQGYSDMRIAKYIDTKTGEVKTSQSLVWTEKGRQFIINQLVQKGGAL